MKPRKILRTFGGFFVFTMRLFLFVFFLFGTTLLDVVPANAQIFQRRRATADETPPNALLVMLPTATRKMAALSRPSDSVRLNSLRYDVAEIQRKMVADFRDNFSFCAVYFFYDTASTAIRSGDYAGHLLDTGLRPASPVLGGDHLIAFFGYRSRDISARQSRANMEYFEMADGDTEAMIQQLVLLDAKMEQLVRPLPRTVANRYPGKKTNEKRPRYVYRHYAKYFDLQYKPSASRASLVLENFYGPQNSVQTISTVAAPAYKDNQPK